MGKLLHFLLTIFVIGGIVTLALAQKPVLHKLGIFGPAEHHILHFVSATLATLLIWTWAKRGNTFWSALWKTILLAAPTPVFVEIVQLWAPYRSSQAADLGPGFWGIAAALLGVGLYHSLKHLLSRSHMGTT